MSEFAIELRDVHLSLGGHPVLEAVDLTVKAEDFLAIIGPNGGGKTSLLKLIMGLLRPDQGTVLVLGKAPAAARGRIAYVPQFASFDPAFPIRVIDVVRMGRLRGHQLLRPPSVTDQQLAMQALERLSIADLAPTPIGSLSGGQLQRVLIARALAVRAEILILDEPTASLDVQGASSFYETLAELAQKMAVVLTSHDIGGVSPHVRDIACLNRRLYSHALEELTPGKLAEIYDCPIELVAHGMPHRVLHPHDNDAPHEHPHRGPEGGTD